MSKGKGVSRRELLTFWRRPRAEASPAPEPAPAAAPRPMPLRPPGMMHELMLVNACTRCGLCVEACPADAIVPLGPEWGRPAGTPAIFPRKQPCVLCDGLKCSHVCPSGALLPVYANRDVMMGTAYVDTARCLPYLGQPCDRCVVTCPMPNAIVAGEGGRVTISVDHCVGCGLCQNVCPVEPAAVTVYPRDAEPPR